MKLYFAYGSNLCVKRFTSPKRVPSASFKCIAQLNGYRVVFQKRSKDGSGKATIVCAPESSVIGVIFTYDESHHGQLKKAEAGYVEQPVLVSTPDGDKEIMTFVCPSEELDSTLRPYDWYIDLIQQGGRSLGLPEAYLSQFDSVPSMIDTDADRVAKERAFLR